MVFSNFRFFLLFLLAVIVVQTENPRNDPSFDIDATFLFIFFCTINHRFKFKVTAGRSVSLQLIRRHSTIYMYAVCHLKQRRYVRARAHTTPIWNSYTENWMRSKQNMLWKCCVLVCLSLSHTHTYPCGGAHTKSHGKFIFRIILNKFSYWLGTTSFPYGFVFHSSFGDFTVQKNFLFTNQSNVFVPFSISIQERKKKVKSLHGAVHRYILRRELSVCAGERTHSSLMLCRL